MIDSEALTASVPGLFPLGLTCHQTPFLDAMPPRRLVSIAAIVGVVITALLILSTTSYAPSIPSSFKSHRIYGPPKLPSFNVPSFRFPFRPAAHRPPEQANSTSGESSWYSDWKWLNPFSSAITLDENRAVLPPLRVRTPIYTFYDPPSKQAPDIAEIDEKLLFLWQRSWWAQGFRPVVLRRADAMNNPLYQSLQVKELEPALEAEIAAWLAWGHMGTGLLASWDCVPMGSFDDQLLSYLRRGQFPILNRFENLGTGLFAGEETNINNAIKDVLNTPKLKSAKTILDAIPLGSFVIEQPTSLAHYDSSIITTKYPTLADKLLASPESGRLALIELMNSHLHLTFQNIFTKGIAVLKPLPEHTTTLVDPAFRLATLLVQCPLSIMPASCPPNRPKCSPCVSSKFRITQPPSFKNTSTLYTIGTVPHPYTLLSLEAQRNDIDLRHIRRETKRDRWLLEITKDILGTGRGGPSRVVSFKEAVAGDFGLSRSLWLTVENLPTTFDTSFPSNLLKNLDWHFGFQIPRNMTDHGESVTPVPGPERRPPPPGSDFSIPPEKELKAERLLIDSAREVLKSKETNRIGIRDIAEAWNLADTEVWRFVRAYRARSMVERHKWEEDEREFLGSGSGLGNARWW